MYDYLFLDLAVPGQGAARALLSEIGGADIGGARGETVGLFTAQLGWRARQAALLLRWRADGPGREAAVARIAQLPSVRKVERERLSPTLRPADEDRPAAGGIYVHRWFVIETPALDEFLGLSQEGWRDFEQRFDASIFGLFTAAASERDEPPGETRLLLITRYGDHGVWEASRDPSTEAMAAFARRQKLTRETWAASTLLFAG